MQEFLRNNSLSVALFGLFAPSFVVHVFSGAQAANEEALLHGEAAKSVGEYLGTSQLSNAKTGH